MNSVVALMNMQPRNDFWANHFSWKSNIASIDCVGSLAFSSTCCVRRDLKSSSLFSSAAMMRSSFDSKWL